MFGAFQERFHGPFPVLDGLMNTVYHISALPAPMSSQERLHEACISQYYHNLISLTLSRGQAEARAVLK